MLVLAGTRLPAQSGAMVIRVVDDSTLAPIPGADLLLDIGRLLRADAQGMLRMSDLAPGEWTLKAMRVGYRPQIVVVRVPAGGELQVEIALRASAVPLPRMIIEGKRLDAGLRRSGFYGRRLSAPTLSWDWREIERHAPGSDVTAVLERIPGYRLVRSDSGWSLVSGRGAAGTSDVCVAALLLNGQRTDPARIGSLPMDQIAGIEAYPGPARTPAELAAGGSRCGVVAIWTGAAR
jgi:hypothetical protein